MMNKCKLCLNRDANQKNSHIIPKFLGRRLFESLKPRYSLSISAKGRTKKVQDIPKENFILCSYCEKRIGILETYFARKIVSIHDFKNQQDKFLIHKKGNETILECLKIHPTSLRLFSYSIVWRLSVTALSEFASFALPSSIESELRVFLDNELPTSHAEMIDSFTSIKNIPKYRLILIKPFMKNEFSRGVFSAFQVSEFLYGIFTVDLAIYFYSSEAGMDKSLKAISNYQNERTIVALASLEHWKSLNQKVIDRLTKNGS